MESQSESNSVPNPEEQNHQKNDSSALSQTNGNEVMIVYDYENEDTTDDYDLALDGFILNGCSEYLYKFSVILLPFMLLLVIFTAIFSSDSSNGLKCKVSVD